MERCDTDEDSSGKLRSSVLGSFRKLFHCCVRKERSAKEKNGRGRRMKSDFALEHAFEQAKLEELVDVPNRSGSQSFRIRKKLVEGCDDEAIPLLS